MTKKRELRATTMMRVMSFAGVSFSVDTVNIVMMIVCGVLGCVFCRKKEKALPCKIVGIAGMAIGISLTSLYAFLSGMLLYSTEMVLFILFIIAADLNTRTVVKAEE